MTDYESMEISAVLIEMIAVACHQQNRTWNMYDLSSQPVGPHWSDTPEWMKESARKGVMAIIAQKNPTPEAIHEEWMKHKKAEGWKYGREKNAEKKEHPCMMPFDELPYFQRMKDVLFISMVQELKECLS